MTARAGSDWRGESIVWGGTFKVSKYAAYFVANGSYVLLWDILLRLCVLHMLYVIMIIMCNVCNIWSDDVVAFVNCVTGVLYRVHITHVCTC